VDRRRAAASSPISGGKAAGSCCARCAGAGWPSSHRRGRQLGRGVCESRHATRHAKATALRRRPPKSRSRKHGARQSPLHPQCFECKAAGAHDPRASQLSAARPAARSAESTATRRGAPIIRAAPGPLGQEGAPDCGRVRAGQRPDLAITAIGGGRGPPLPPGSGPHGGGGSRGGRLTAGGARVRAGGLIRSRGTVCFAGSRSAMSGGASGRAFRAPRGG
jgi:hypothetical protein